MKFEFLEHTSEVKFRAYGKDLQEVFSNVVLAFSDFVSKGKGIKSRKAKVVEVFGENKENLLYKFLEELIYLLDVENFVVAKAEIFFRGNNLKAEIYGDDAKNYKGLDYVKAATYSEMKIVEKTREDWIAEVVIDV